jgi:hypothetical protein
MYTTLLGFWRMLRPVVIFALVAGLKDVSSKTRNVTILARALSYELTFEERVGESVGVAVIYKSKDAASEANADEWMQALGELATTKIKDRPIFAKKVANDVADMNAAVDQGADVLFAADSLNNELGSIAQVARARHVLTASATLEYTQTFLTLCVTEELEKPKIYVNLNAAQLEGIRFSSHLLNLVNIIR